MINAVQGRAATGSGHNATTLRQPPVVAPVVGKTPTKTSTYQIPQRHHAEMHPPTCARTPARAHDYLSIYIRCAVVDIYYLSEIIAFSPTTQATTGPEIRCGAVVAWPNPLKNNKKGGFYAET
jgi:hypothetical protein